MTRADLDKQPGDVAAMFDGIAERYDLMNDLLSAGQVRLWRRAVARIIGARPGDRVLDLAAGTGTSALSFTAAGADCVACDFSLGMLRAGQSRLAQRGTGRNPVAGSVGLVAGDALRLPFRDAAFDAVTISFGLRNVARPAAALAEMHQAPAGPGGLRVRHDYHRPPRYALPALPDQCPPGGRAAHGPQSGGLHLPRRVDHRLARPARAGRRDRGGRLVGGALARPEPGRGRGARRPPPHPRQRRLAPRRNKPLGGGGYR